MSRKWLMREKNGEIDIGDEGRVTPGASFTKKKEEEQHLYSLAHHKRSEYQRAVGLGLSESAGLCQTFKKVRKAREGKRGKWRRE